MLIDEIEKGDMLLFLANRDIDAVNHHIICKGTTDEQAVKVTEKTKWDKIN